MASSNRLVGVLRLWFGFEAPVRRASYLWTGVALMALKYALEAGLVRAVAGVSWLPGDFLSPFYSVRLETLREGPEWLPIALAISSLPFLWIGVSMSVRRAANAGLSPWWGLAFLVPFLNYLTMAGLSAWPESLESRWRESRAALASEPSTQALHSALLGVGLAVLLGLAMVGISVYALGLYGWTLFFATPFLMGALSAFLFNRPEARTLGQSVLVALISVAICGSAILLFALDGLVCLAMAMPIALLIGLMGGLVGHAIARHTEVGAFQSTGVLLFLLPLVGTEAALAKAPLREVRSSIEVDAPPERVWPNVVGFSELPAPDELLFATGIAYPLRAQIEGRGVGAVRTCEFSTGPFVEPITLWDEPRRLGFDVSSQPPAMHEWSPFAQVHPPHLDGSLSSKRGEFRLIPLEGGRTRLEGSTWYELSIYPSGYWQAWSDVLIHTIHRRVLKHIKQLSEADTR